MPVSSEPVQQAAPKSPHLMQVPPVQRVCEALQDPAPGLEPQQGKPGPPQAPHEPLLQIPSPKPTQAVPAAMQIPATQQPPDEHTFASQHGVPGKPQLIDPPLPLCIPPPAPPAPPPLATAVASRPLPPLPMNPAIPPAPGCAGARSAATLPSPADASIVLELLQPCSARAATATTITILGLGTLTMISLQRKRTRAQSDRLAPIMRR